MKISLKSIIKNLSKVKINIKNKNMVALATSALALVLVAVIVIISVAGSNSVITKNGDLMKGVSGARVKNEKITDGFEEVYANFCLDLLVNTTKETNIAFAPSNILSAIALMGHGAEHNTKLEIEKTLGMPSLEIGKQLSNLENRIKYNDKNAAGLRYSNNILLNNATLFGVKPKFLKDNAKYFGLGVDRISYSNEKEVKEVFQKYAEETSYISAINYKLEKLQYMNIFSNAAFTAKWEDEVSADDNGHDIFQGNNATTEANYFKFIADSYIKGGAYQGFTKKLEGNYTFVGLITNEYSQGSYYSSDMIFTELAETGQFKNILSTATDDEEVAVWLPIYNNNSTATKTITFTSTLKNMGIKTALDKTATFNNMVEVSDNLHISEVAASGNVTLCAAGVCDTRSNQKKSNAKKVDECENKLAFNREFSYLIIDNKTGLPIYCAIVRNLD